MCGLEMIVPDRSTSPVGLALPDGGSAASSVIQSAVIGCVLLVTLAVAVLFAWWCRRRQQNSLFHELGQPRKSSNEHAMTLSAVLLTVDHLIENNQTVHMGNVCLAHLVFFPYVPRQLALSLPTQLRLRVK